VTRKSISVVADPEVVGGRLRRFGDGTPTGSRGTTSDGVFVSEAPRKQAES